MEDAAVSFTIKEESPDEPLWICDTAGPIGELLESGCYTLELLFEVQITDDSLHSCFLQVGLCITPTQVPRGRASSWRRAVAYPIQRSPG